MSLTQFPAKTQILPTYAQAEYRTRVAGVKGHAECCHSVNRQLWGSERGKSAPNDHSHRSVEHLEQVLACMHI